jgi:hypothetical protein
VVHLAPGLTIRNYKFCPSSLLLWLLQISEQVPVFSPHVALIDWLL